MVNDSMGNMIIKQNRKREKSAQEEKKEERQRKNRKKLKRHALDSLHLLYAFPFDWTCCFIVQFKLQCSNAVNACHFSHVSLLPQTAFLSLAFAMVLVISRVYLFGVHYNIYSHRILQCIPLFDVGSCYFVVPLTILYFFCSLFFSFGVNVLHCYKILYFFFASSIRRDLTHS